jgi:hypothetical protein
MNRVVSDLPFKMTDHDCHSQESSRERPGTLVAFVAEPPGATPLAQPTSPGFFYAVTSSPAAGWAGRWRVAIC